MTFFTTNTKLKEAWPDPVAATYAQRDILLKKPSFLEWHRTVYEMVCADLACGDKNLEIGAGSSFLYEYIPGLIKANVIHIQDNDITFNAYCMPFRYNSLDNIIIINVLHHFNDPFEFFHQANKALRPGGRILISDPYISYLSFFAWKFLHPESCDMRRPGYDSIKGNPLHEANSATATLLFIKNERQFLDRFSDFMLIKRKYHTIFHYWMAGGYNFPSLIPIKSLKIVTAMEKIFAPFSSILSSFIFVVIEKNKD